MMTHGTLLRSGLILGVFALLQFGAPVRAGAVGGPKSANIGIGGETIKIEFRGGEPAAIAAASHAATYGCTIEVLDPAGKRVAIDRGEADQAKRVRARLVVWVPAKTGVYTIKISVAGEGSYKTN